MFSAIIEFLRDVRYAIRAIVKRPLFSAVVFGTLALGAGGTTAILLTGYTIFLAPLPFPHPDELVRIRSANTGPTGVQNTFNLHGAEILELQRQGANGPFSSLLAEEVESRTLTGEGEGNLLRVAAIYGDWRTVLGVAPVQGRWFTPEEGARGNDSGVVLISAALWKSRFGSRADTMGRSITLDGRDKVIIGVMPDDFHFPYVADAWTPTTMTPQNPEDYGVYGRLKPGFTIQGAAGAVAPVSGRLTQIYPSLYTTGLEFKLTPLRESLVGDQRRPAITLAASAGFFLILASFNIASLLLARSITQRHQVQVRVALGAGRWHLVRAGLAEAMVYSLGGGLAGLLLAVQSAPLLRDVVPSVLTRQLGFTGRGTVALAAGLSIVLGLLTAMLAFLPALANTSARADNANRGGARTGRSHTERRWLDCFVALEFVIALALTSGAGLMMRNFSLLTHRDLGIDASHLLAIRVSTSNPRFAIPDARLKLTGDLVRSAESTAGVLSAAICTVNPLGGNTWSAPVVIEGRELSDSAVTFVVNHRLVTPRFFETMGIHLLQGRLLTAADGPASRGVAVVSLRMARKYWPGADAIGKRVRVNRRDRPWLTVVGVVSDVEDFTDLHGSRETWYLPYAQNANSNAAADIVLMARSVGSPQSVEHAVEQNVHAANRDLALYDSAAMDGYYLDTLSHQRLSSVLIAIMAGFGLLLSGLGIYGTLMFSVGERIREIGIRMALGSTREGILALVLKQGMRLALIASLIGIAAAWAMGRLLASQLSEVRPSDPLTIVGSVVVLLIVACLAIYGPARRAAKLDPIVCLRRE